MDASLIEKLDRRRYRLSVWKTASFIVFWAGVMLAPYVCDKPAKIVFWSLFAVGAAVFVPVAFRLALLESRIARDEELNRALNNEMYRHYLYLSMSWGFWLMIGIAFAAICVIQLFGVVVSALTICAGLIYVGIVFQKVAQLIYNR